MTVRRRLSLLLGLLAALTLLAAGCGGKKQAAASSSGAQFVRSDALAFVSVDTDFGSSQWKQVDSIASKFPGRDKAIESLKKSIAGQGVDFDSDIKPALGSELDFAVAGGATLNDTKAIGLLQPGDEGKFKALVDKENKAQPDSKSVYRKLSDGWYAIASTQADIDQVLKGSNPPLSDESLYKDALAKQPSDALAKAYVNGPELGKVVQKAIEARGNGLSDSTTSGLQKLDFVSASLSAEDDGVRLHGAVQGSGSESLLGSGDYASKLLGETPSDAFAFLTFKVGKNTASGLGSVTAPFEQTLGVSLQDVLALLENENAIYVRPGAVIPEFAAIFQPNDTSKGMATLIKIANRLAASGGATVTGGAEKTLSFGTQFQLHFGVKDADQIADAVLDAVLTDDPSGRVACETLITTGLVVVAGEITTETYVDIPALVRKKIAEIGYTHSEWGFDAHTCGVVVALDEQSPDIAQGVDESFERQHDPADDDPLDRIGAGEQGMMFGYASAETPELMPVPIMLAHKICRRLAEVRKVGELPYLRPDGKAQVTVRYEVDDAGRQLPVEIERILISTQHAEGCAAESLIKPDLIERVLHPILPRDLYDEKRFGERDFVYVNPTGKFVIGGPMGDTGLTGRKIIVDTYGGAARHGGGAFSGKDPTKVDRSAAYAARYVAKNVVAAGLAERCEVNVAYATGVAHPVSVGVQPVGP